MAASLDCSTESEVVVIGVVLKGKSESAHAIFLVSIFKITRKLKHVLF